MKPHVWFIALLALGCAHTSETWPSWFEDGAACLTVPWDDLPQAAGEIAVLSCGTSVDCPPPLICRGNICEIERDVRDPTSIAELYGRPVFRVTATAGDDYNYLAFESLPSEALYVHCAFYNCPIDKDVIQYSPKRCRITTEIVELGTSNTLALTSITDGPTVLELTSAEKACYAPDDTDSERHLPIQIGTIGFFGYCLAYGETDIEAVSDIFQLDRTEIGEIGRQFYSERCEGEASDAGDPCIRYVLDDDDGSLVEDTHPGVCVPTTPTDERDPSALCCPVCFGANECRPQGLGGDTEDPRCYSIGGFSRPDGEDAEPAPPFVGYCATTRCSSDRGDIWILDADGTMTADDDGDQQEDPPEQAPDGGMPPDDGGMGMDLDAGPPPDGMAPGPDMGPPEADMGPPEADMGPPEADMDEAADAARMPRPDMMEPPR